RALAFFEQRALVVAPAKAAVAAGLLVELVSACLVDREPAEPVRVEVAEQAAAEAIVAARALDQFARFGVVAIDVLRDDVEIRFESAAGFERRLARAVIRARGSDSMGVLADALAHVLVAELLATVRDAPSARGFAGGDARRAAERLAFGRRLRGRKAAPEK